MSLEWWLLRVCRRRWRLFQVKCTRPVRCRNQRRRAAALRRLALRLCVGVIVATDQEDKEEEEHNVHKDHEKAVGQKDRQVEHREQVGVNNEDNVKLKAQATSVGLFKDSHKPRWNELGLAGQTQEGARGTRSRLSKSRSDGDANLH